MVDTGGSLCHAAKALVEIGGAKDVTACASHGVLSGPAIDRLAASPITELAILDTINIPQEKMLPSFRIISTAPIFASAIENVYLDRPMSKIYD